MDAVANAISDLDYAFQLLQEQLASLSEVEMTEEIVDEEDGCTVRDVLAHLTGWADYVLEVLPVMLATIDNQLPPVDVAGRNRRALADREGKSAPEILAEFKQKHRQIVSLLETISSEAFTLRRTRQGKIFTIKSYVVDVMEQHILEHMEQLRAWRKKRSDLSSELQIRNVEPETQNPPRPGAGKPEPPNLKLEK
jgi:hypothetical protein